MKNKAFPISMTVLWGMGQAFRYKLIMGLAAFVPYYLVCMAFPRQVLSLMLVGNSQAGPILDEAVKYTLLSLPGMTLPAV